MSNKERAIKRKPNRGEDNPTQSKRFLEAAREAEADESEEGADRAFKKVAIKRGAKRSQKK